MCFFLLLVCCAYFSLLVVFANIYILIKSAVVCLCIQNGLNLPPTRSCTQPLYGLIFRRNGLIIHSNEKIKNKNIFKIVIDIDTKRLYPKWMSLLCVWINWSNDRNMLNQGGKMKRSVQNVKSLSKEIWLFTSQNQKQF